MDSGELHVRRAAPGDEAVLRDLRLQAMSDAPEAFGSTYEREAARTTSDWQRWLSSGATFLLDTPSGPQGIVAAVRDASDGRVVHLMAMWLHPTTRGSGASDKLVGAVIAWAELQGARVVRLDVIHANEPARRCYARNGFRATGHEERRERDGQVQVRMERPIPE